MHMAAEAGLGHRSWSPTRLWPEWLALCSLWGHRLQMIIKIPVGSCVVTKTTENINYQMCVHVYRHAHAVFSVEDQRTTFKTPISFHLSSWDGQGWQVFIDMSSNLIGPPSKFYIPPFFVNWILFCLFFH